MFFRRWRYVRPRDFRCERPNEQPILSEVSNNFTVAHGVDSFPDSDR